MGSMLTGLWVLWAAITLAFIVVMIWKSLVGLKEEDVVILDPAEDSLASEQKITVARVERLALWAKGFGFASLAVLILTCSLSLYRALHAMGGS